MATEFDMPKAVLDLSKVPGELKIKNNGTKRRVISISGSNQQFPLEPEQEITVYVATTSDIIGYLSQEDDDLEVTLPTERIGA